MIVIGWLSVLQITNSDILVLIRQALLTDFEARSELFSLPPADYAKRTDFFEYLPANIARFRESLKNTEWGPEFLARIDQISAEIGTVQKMQSIAKLFTINGGKTCGKYLLLNDIIRSLYLPVGDAGCCSDFVAAYMASALMVGLYPREVLNSVHNTAEVYDPALKKWIWIDPQFSMMAKGSDDQYLSGWDLRERVLQGESFAFEFVGKQEKPARVFPFIPDGIDAYAADNWAVEFGLVEGNNIFTNHFFMLNLEFFPTKALKQSIAFVSGVFPKYRYYRAQDSELVNRYLRIRLTFWAAIATMCGFNFFAFWVEFKKGKQHN